MELKQVTEERLPDFKEDIKQLYIQTYERKFGKSAEKVIKDSLIEDLFKDNPLSFEALEGDERAGGIIIELSPDGLSATYRISYSNDSDRHEAILTFIEDELEKVYPNVKQWISYAVKAEQEHIRFLKNRGFRIVSTLTKRHMGPRCMLRNYEPKERAFYKLVKRIG